jgi:hypothetical protein
MSSDSLGFDFFTFSRLPRKLTGILELPGMMSVFLGCYLPGSRFEQSNGITNFSIVESDHCTRATNGIEDGKSYPRPVPACLWLYRYFYLI